MLQVLYNAAACDVEHISDAVVASSDKVESVIDEGYLARRMARGWRDLESFLESAVLDRSQLIISVAVV